VEVDDKLHIHHMYHSLLIKCKYSCRLVFESRSDYRLSFALKMDAAWSSETFISFHKPRGMDLKIHLKSRNLIEEYRRSVSPW